MAKILVSALPELGARSPYFASMEFKSSVSMKSTSFWLYWTLLR
ncbi:hypothetical protein [Marinobacter sp. EN3]|nr:hypothetical protein [Marinobacter sp. EN3]